jgi:hypothetical protein
MDGWEGELRVSYYYRLDVDEPADAGRALVEADEAEGLVDVAVLLGAVPLLETLCALPVLLALEHPSVCGPMNFRLCSAAAAATLVCAASPPERRASSELRV